MDAGTSNILKKSIQEQKKYVKRDAELVMLLAQYNNCIVLRLMKVLEYAEMDYYKICHTNVSSWYENKYTKMTESGGVSVDYSPDYKLQKRDIGGGHHTVPKKGFFVNTTVYELDVKGMYPTIAINKNLSFDTINCICCKDEPTAQVDQDTINIINENIKENKINRVVTKYWVCKKKKVHSLQYCNKF